MQGKRIKIYIFLKLTTEKSTLTVFPKLLLFPSQINLGYSQSFHAACSF